jgi:endonuclease/exonuclease/phosphatase family metal-dependent hydrolase
MGRGNLMAVVEFALPDTESTFKLAVNCTHLESLNNPTHRISQLQEIEALNKGMDMSIIAGDFNFSDGCPEDEAIKDYVDVWKVGKRTFSQWAN